jgi:uncharacterized coiled-coil protein SlyX
MKLELDVHVHFPQDPEVLRRLDALQASLDRLEAKEAVLMKELDDLTAQVTENTSAEQSAIVLLGNLHDLIVAAGTDPQKLQALTDKLAASKTDLAAAIVANTPAA